VSRTYASLLAACLLLPSISQAAAPPAPPGRDRFGDPLPPRALARAGTLRLRHAGLVRAARFSADGKTITSFGDDHVLRVWDVATGRILASRPLRGFRVDGVEAAALSADGKLLAVAGGDGKDYSTDAFVVIYEIRSGKEVVRLRVPDAAGIYCLDFSRDGKLIAAGGDNLVRVWAVEGGLAVSRIAWDEGMVTALAFSPDGRTLAAVNGVDTLTLWDAASGKRLLRQKKTWRANVQLDENFLARVTFSADGRLLLTANSDWAVRLWDARTGKLMKVVVEPARRDVWQMYSDVAFAADGKSIFTHLNVVERVEVATGKSRLLFRTDPTGSGMLPSHATRPSLAVSPDGRTLAAWGRSNALRLWDLHNDREVRPSAGHRAGLLAVALSLDGRTLATGGDGQLGLWDARTGAARRLELVGWQARSLAFTPDGKTLAWVNGYGYPSAVFRREASTGRPLPELDVGHGGRGWDALACAGGVLAVCDTEEVLLYDLAAKKVVRRLASKQTCCLCFTPDGKRLAVGTDRPITGGTIRLYESPGWGQVPGFTGEQGSVSGIALSPDGRAVASVTGGRVLLWEGASGEVRRRIEGASCANFSPDGRLLAVGDPDGLIRLCDPLSGKEWSRLKGHQGGVTALAFSAEGLTLASGSEDATALVWDVAGIGRVHGEPADLDEPWEALLGGAPEASRAAAALLSSPGKAVAFLRDRVRPPSFDRDRIRRRVADLDSDDHEVREIATQELRLAGKAAGPFLKRALSADSLEVRRRAGRLLGDLSGPVPSPLTLRNLRAIEVLEHAGAREALERLARLPGDSREAREAKEALARLRDRKR
jgi:WD40 repeat protein